LSLCWSGRCSAVETGNPNEQLSKSWRGKPQPLSKSSRSEETLRILHKVLLDAGLMTMRREGTRRLYQARPEGLAELRKFMDGFWDTHLSLLKREAEADERRKRRRGRRRS
jgi:DNA-binding transcriptional ArsR family regulator